jgi:hypothetical protein
MNLSRVRFLAPVLALLAGFTLLSAVPASASGTCSVNLPSRLTVDAPFERFTGRLASDCAGSDADYASWDIRHAYYGPSDLFIFDSGHTSATWDFYDWDHLGTYYVEPSWASDHDYNELSQNTRKSVVRLGSRLSLTSARSGNYVTLRSTATRYRPSADAFRPWAGKAVGLSYRTCATCAWHYLTSRATNADGTISYRLYAPRARSYRAHTADISTTWGRTTGASRR